MSTLIDRVARALEDRDADVRAWGMLRAGQLGDEGGRLLAEWVPQQRGQLALHGIQVLACLDDEASLEALRGQCERTGPGSRDLRAAAVGGLGYRLGAAATGELAAFVEHGPAECRRAALHALAQHGDGRAWETVLAWLKTYTAPARMAGSQVRAGVTYLVRQADSSHSRADVVAVLERRRAKLSEADIAFLDEHWPGLDLGIDPGAAQGWVESYGIEGRTARDLQQDLGDEPRPITLGL